MDYIVGIDEVGRGSLAGPVVVVAMAIPRNFRLKKNLGPLHDSKKLTASARETWFKLFEDCHEVFYSAARVSPKGIDTMNISASANLAAFRAYRGVLRKNKKIERSHHVILDGGLYLKNKRHSLSLGAKTIIKGDENHLAIMMASVVAKVIRDRYMMKLAKKYPAYGFELHKGYGTRIHREALQKVGPSPVHRLTFLRKYATIIPIK